MPSAAASWEIRRRLKVHLINPSHISFGTAVITPRWLYVLAAATPARFGDPVIVDETLALADFSTLEPGDVVGIGIHTANALRGYELGRQARERGAWVIFGGIHATLYPEEAHELGGAHGVVRGDGDVVWQTVLDDCASRAVKRVYAAASIEAYTCAPQRWNLLPPDRYMCVSVQSARGCRKQRAGRAVWRMDGHQLLRRGSVAVIRDLVDLRRLRFRFV